MMESGRRIGTEGSQVMCAKVPGAALRAAVGAGAAAPAGGSRGVDIEL